MSQIIVENEKYPQVNLFDIGVSLVRNTITDEIALSIVLNNKVDLIIQRPQLVALRDMFLAAEPYVKTNAEYELIDQQKIQKHFAQCYQELIEQGTIQ